MSEVQNVGQTIDNTRIESYGARRENWASGIFTSVKYLIPTLVALLAMKFQGKPMGPFETNPANIWAFTISIVIYFMGFTFLEDMQQNEQWPVCSQIFTHVILSSGSLSSASLLSVLGPPWFGFIVFFLWAILSAIAARCLFVSVFRLFCAKTERLVFYVHNIFCPRSMTRGPTISTEQPRSDVNV